MPTTNKLHLNPMHAIYHWTEVRLLKTSLKERHRCGPQLAIEESTPRSLGQRPVNRKPPGGVVNGDFPHKLTPVKLSTRDTRNSKARYGLICRKGNVIVRAVPCRVNNGRLRVEACRSAIADQIIGDILDW